mgnify:CR=1 FL=1
MCSVVCLHMKSLNCIYFTNDYKTSYTTYINHALDTDVCVQMVFVWEETGVPGRNSGER